jgi:formate dehydrogenase subunit delta
MMSPDDRLVYMANQIARNIAAQGHDAAILILLDHIIAFWDPRMKARILAIDGQGLEPIARAAVAMLRDHVTPPPQSGATVFATASGGSDAG